MEEKKFLVEYNEMFLKKEKKNGGKKAEKCEKYKYIFFLSNTFQCDLW